MWGTENWGLVAIGGAASFVASILYMIGGTSGFAIAVRRYIASAIIAGATIFIAIAVHRFVWQYLLVYPALILGFSLPYGASTTIDKVVKRTVFAVGVLLACVCGLWATGFTAMGIVVMTIASLVGMTSEVMGVVNPWSNAPLEQFLICQVLCLFVPWWPLI